MAKTSKSPTNNKTVKTKTVKVGNKNLVTVTSSKTMSDNALKAKLKKLDNARNRQLQRTERVKVRFQDNKAYATGKGIGEATKPMAASISSSNIGRTTGNSVVQMRQAKYGSPIDTTSLATSEDEEDRQSGWNRDTSRY